MVVIIGFEEREMRTVPDLKVRRICGHRDVLSRVVDAFRDPVFVPSLPPQAAAPCAHHGQLREKNAGPHQEAIFHQLGA